MILSRTWSNILDIYIKSRIPIFLCIRFDSVHLATSVWTSVHSFVHQHSIRCLSGVFPCCLVQYGLCQFIERSIYIDVCLRRRFHEPDPMLPCNLRHNSTFSFITKQLSTQPWKTIKFLIFHHSKPEKYCETKYMLRIQVFWDVMLCCWTTGSRSFFDRWTTTDPMNVLGPLNACRWRQCIPSKCHTKW